MSASGGDKELGGAGTGSRLTPPLVKIARPLSDKNLGMTGRRIELRIPFHSLCGKHRGEAIVASNRARRRVSVTCLPFQYERPRNGQ